MTDTAERNPLDKRRPTQVVAPGIYQLGLQGNSFIVETEQGLLVVDTGPSPDLVPDALADLRQHTDAPIRWIVYSHGHMGYNYGVPGFLADAERRGDPRPTIIAHENVVRRYRRYAETGGLQAHLNSMQFRRAKAAFPAVPPQTFPDQTYAESLTLGTTGRVVQLLWAPSETDDVTAVWLPQERILYGSAAVIESIPNIGTPLRTLRDPVRWADTLDRFAALDPAVVVPEWGKPRREKVGEMLTETARALRWLRAEVVARLNKGMAVGEILHDLDYPAELFDEPWMAETYGHRDFVVRDIVRAETGWWDFNPTNLHPSHPDVAAAAVAGAIADQAAVLAPRAARRGGGAAGAARDRPARAGARGRAGDRRGPRAEGGVVRAAREAGVELRVAEPVPGLVHGWSRRRECFGSLWRPKTLTNVAPSTGAVATRPPASPPATGVPRVVDPAARGL
ncbi:alkyl sulfatase dimerization domain-containing protein [Saccharopolyspora shandongensis]|uniref:alkyl sulfatase dimerization domain-containing protein n=1 Tax=Saccharopolyspora shandongensis TaxID=418495 RepID=UPI003F4CD85C